MNDVSVHNQKHQKLSMLQLKKMKEEKLIKYNIHNHFLKTKEKDNIRKVWVKYKRLSKNISYRDFSACAGIYPSTLIDFENDNRKFTELLLNNILDGHSFSFDEDLRIFNEAFEQYSIILESIYSEQNDVDAKIHQFLKNNRYINSYDFQCTYFVFTIITIMNNMTNYSN